MSRAEIGQLGAEQLSLARRPRGSHPAVIARALGIEGRPCAEEDALRLEGATATTFRYAWLRDDTATRARAFLGLARSLLLRSDVRHMDGDAQALALVLEARPDLA